jgi:dihydroorotate dehydrogenase
MNIYKIFRPLIFKLDPENAHNLALKFLKFLPNFATSLTFTKSYENLKLNLFNINFDSPIGMAAGFDKNAEIVKSLARFGFGFVEAGTTTPRPQTGNEKPRIFRLQEDEALINRLGFNNLGADMFLNNINRAIKNLPCPLGVNIGKNKDTQNALDDYLFLLEKFYDKASYITINISSPNTKNLRDLQKEENLDLFLSEINKKREQLKTNEKKTPLLLKIAPDLSLQEQEIIAQTVLKNRIDGLIISNTTIYRALNLKSQYANEAGGLSGKPLFSKSNEVLKNFYKLTNGKIPLIGVGGVASACDIYEKIKCGASLVQVYSAFIYQGFGIVEKWKEELSLMVEKDGFKNISKAIGSKL